MWIYRLFPGFCLGHGLFERLGRLGQGTFFWFRRLCFSRARRLCLLCKLPQDLYEFSDLWAAQYTSEAAWVGYRWQGRTVSVRRPHPNMFVHQLSAPFILNVDLLDFPGTFWHLVILSWHCVTLSPLISRTSKLALGSLKRNLSPLQFKAHFERCAKVCRLPVTFPARSILATFGSCRWTCALWGLCSFQRTFTSSSQFCW